MKFTLPEPLVIQQRQEYQFKFEKEFNAFASNTPLLQENSVAINKFLTDAARQDPVEKKNAEKRRVEVAKLNNFLRVRKNPNATSTRDAVNYDYQGENVNPKYGDISGNKFEKEILHSLDSFTENIEENSNTRGGIDVGKTLENVLTEIRLKEEGSFGGILGVSSGVNSIGSGLSTDNYLKICGIESTEEFQRLVDTKTDPQQTEENGSLLYDQTKLIFLPDEIRPSISVPPSGILPVNNKQQLIGKTPMFGNPSDENTASEITTMEVDENLLTISEANIRTRTRTNEVDVMSEEMRDGNYAKTVRNLKTFSDLAMYVLQICIRDVVQCGRIDQSMVANAEVIGVTQIMLRVIEILLNKQSSFFAENKNRLHLINVDSIQDSQFPYFSLIANNQPVMSLFEVFRNIFNFKMEAVTELQYRQGISESENGDSLNVFKQFFYHVVNENGLRNIDELLVFRSAKRFRQSTMLLYQNLDPQMRARNFFIMYDNFLMQLHVSGSTDYTQTTIFNSVLESDLYRRMNGVIFNFMSSVNATIERLLVNSPFSLVFTENENRANTIRSMSYRRALQTILQNVSNLQIQPISSTNNSPEDQEWKLLFQNRNDESIGSKSDIPPSGSTLQRLIMKYRSGNYTSSRGTNVQGGEWSGLEPSHVMEILMFAFVEHEIIPPMEGKYSTELSNFFSILTSDPMQQVFIRHLRHLYRRGWKKDTLARKACIILAEQYVGLILMVVQQALLQNDCTMSTTSSFTANVTTFIPLTKIQDAIRTLLLTFDPISYLTEEVVNRDSHEAKFAHNFKQYSTYVNEIVSSYQMWLQETIDAYGNGQSNISRENHFLNIIAAGGYEESRNNFLNAVPAVIAESDEATQTTQTNDQAVQFDDESNQPLEQVEITIKNTGTTPMVGPKVLNNPALVVTGDRNTPSVIVDASHPSVNALSTTALLKIVSQAVEDKMALFVKKVVVPEDNRNSSSSTKSYLAYASTVDYGGEVTWGNQVEESVHPYDIQDEIQDVLPSDSASQLGEVEEKEFEAYGDGLSNLSTVDYNAPNQLILSTVNENLQEVYESQVKVNIREPRQVLADNSEVDVVSENGQIGDVDLLEYDIASDGEVEEEVEEEEVQQLPSDLQDRIEQDDILNTPIQQLVYIDEIPSENVEIAEGNAKNKYTISRDIKSSNNFNITQRLARLGKKAQKDQTSLNNVIRKSKDRNKTISENVKTAIEKGLLEKRHNIGTRAKKLDDLRIIEQSVEGEKTAKEQLQKRAKERDTVKNLPYYERNNETQKTKKIVISSGKKKRSKPYLRVVDKPSSKAVPKTIVNKLRTRIVENRKQTNTSSVVRAMRKRHLINEEEQYKNRVRKAAQIKRRRNVPERLVTKPLPDGNPFTRGLELSAYDVSSSIGPSVTSSEFSGGARPRPR